MLCINYIVGRVITLTRTVYPGPFLSQHSSILPWDSRKFCLSPASMMARRSLIDFLSVVLLSHVANTLLMV